MTTPAAATPGDYPAVSVNQFAVLTPDEMEEIDDSIEEEIGLSLFQMMENAGRDLAELTRNQFGRQASICVVAGKGNNGGGGLVAARHLRNWGHRVCVILATPSHFLRPIPLHQMRVLTHLDCEITHAWEIGGIQQLSQKMAEAEGIIDALLGYHLLGKPQDIYADLIRAMNLAGKPIIALDTPSGLDLRDGTSYDPTVKANLTLTLAAPKVGLLKSGALPFVGEIFVGDISIPAGLLKRFGGTGQTPFALSPIVRLQR